MKITTYTIVSVTLTPNELNKSINVCDKLLEKDSEASGLSKANAQLFLKMLKDNNGKPNFRVPLLTFNAFLETNIIKL